MQLEAMCNNLSIHNDHRCEPLEAIEDADNENIWPLVL